MSTAISIIKGERKWFEHHANHFAACLLMPRQLVNELYAYLHKIYIEDVYGDKPGPLYYHPDQEETWDSYNKVVGGMAKILNVSRIAMHYRLKKLYLLISPADD